MTVAEIVLAVLVLALAAALLRRRRRRPRLAAPARRILFPFVGPAVSQRALDATLRLAQAEDAVLLPAYLTAVPLDLPISAATPAAAMRAMPVFDEIEARAAACGIAVDPRIERGRTVRHALREAIANGGADRIVLAAATSRTDGVSPEDVAWLLDRGSCEILVLRPALDEGARRDD